MQPNKSLNAITKNAASPYKMVCQRVRTVRLNNKLTQKEFALKLKTTRENLNQIERGTHAPSIQIMRMLKKNYGITYGWLIDGKDE